MNNLSGAVTKTMNMVFADIETSTNEAKLRISTLKANIGKIANIPLDEIQTNENIRKTIDTDSESFSRLVESIKKYGVLENVVVELRLNKKETEYKLVCVAGHRRILAAKEAKTIKKVPCLLQLYSNRGDNVGAALAENLNREDLHCLDVADGYRGLSESGWSEDDLATHFCRDNRTIRHYLKMAEWPDDVKKILRENPKVFSTRTIMRQFAYKKFGSVSELKASIKDFISPKQKPKASRAQSAPASGAKAPDKAAMRAALKTYLVKQKLLSELIKEEIRKAFEGLKLI